MAAKNLDENLKFIPRDEINIDEMTRTEITTGEMIPQGTFDELVRHLTASPPRKQTRVKLRIPAFLSGSSFFGKVNLVSISSKAMGIDRDISIKHCEKFQITIQTDPPMMFKCAPIVGSREFSTGTWNRLNILTDFRFEKAIKLLYYAAVREARERK